MCIVIDANQLGAFLNNADDADAMPIRRWLNKGFGRIVYSTGGSFADEVGRGYKQRLEAYVRAGQAKLVPAARFADDEKALLPHTRSDDPHVLALARCEGVRLLYMKDNRLIADFKDKEFVRPRGKVYSGFRNANLLTKTACAS